MSFWDMFYQACIKKGTKPNPVGKKIGVSSATITKWKQGTTPNGDTIKKIAEVLDVSTDYLLERKSSSHEITDEDLKFALFGGEKGITDEDMEAVKSFAEFIKSKHKK